MFNVINPALSPQFSSSFSSVNNLPPNLLLPSNLVDPDRLSESEAASAALTYFKHYLLLPSNTVLFIFKCQTLTGLCCVPPPERPPPSADCSLPLLRQCDAVVPAHLSPIHTWVESLEDVDSEPSGVAELHPDVFGVPPR